MKITVKYIVLIIFKGVTICPAGDEGPGGECDCSNAALWTEAEWPSLTCHKGNCYASQENDLCNGKLNLYKLGNGTFCYDSDRVILCSTRPGISSL